MMPPTALPDEHSPHYRESPPVSARVQTPAQQPIERAFEAGGELVTPLQDSPVQRPTPPAPSDLSTATTCCVGGVNGEDQRVREVAQALSSPAALRCKFAQGGVDGRVANEFLFE